MWIVNLVIAWIGIAVEYLIAIALIVGGAYIAVFFDLAVTNPLAFLIRPLRVVGYALIACGLVLGGVTYGKGIGGAAVEAQWKAKNLEAQIARLKQERDAKQAAATYFQEKSDELAKQDNDNQIKIGDYRVAVAAYSTTLRACRLATDDDVRRLCDITRNAAPGCKSSR